MSRCLTLGLVLCSLALTACAEEEPPPEPEDTGPSQYTPTATSYALPLDGQSGIRDALDLIVVSPGLEIPPGYPQAQAIRVVDLTTGGFVAGETRWEDGFIRFSPTNPWTNNRRFSWTIDIPEPIPHGPEYDVPQALNITSVFDTSEDLAMLAGTVEPSGRACIVLSRPLGPNDGAEPVVTINDVPLERASFDILPDSEREDDVSIRSEADDGIEVLCLEDSSGVGAGAAFRLWWGESGPWLVDLYSYSVPELLIALRSRNGL